MVRLNLDALRSELQQFAEAGAEPADGSDAANGSTSNVDRKWFPKKYEIDSAKLLSEKNQILTDVLRKVEEEQFRSQQFNPVQQSLP